MPKDYEDDALFHSMQLGLSAGGGRNTSTIAGKQADTTDNDDTTFFEISTSTNDSGDPGLLTWGFSKGTGRSVIRLIMDVKVEHSGEDGYYEIWGWDSDGNYEKIGTIRTAAYTFYLKRYFYKECDKVYYQLDLRFYSEVNTHKTYAKIYTFENTLKPQYSLPAGTNSIGQVEQNPDILSDNSTTVRTKSHNILVAQKALNSSYTAEAIGSSAAVPTANFTILSNATVVHPGGVQAEIVSTSANDTAAGTGIRKLKLTYFNSSYEKLTEIITMNGLVNVNTTETDIWRIHSLEAIEIGNGVFAVGTITIKSVGGANLFAQIDIGNNFFTRCLRYVQPGKQGFVQDILVSSTTKEGVDFRLFGDVNNDAIGGGKVSLGRYAAECVDDVLPIHFDMPIVIDASNSAYPLGFGIAVQGKAAAQNATASIKYWEE